ncbi:hypothetical protein GA0061098_104615 [Bradyrhizobium shewense]|uniref:Uncharacterized protein n=1 Tax=Bradyrhizobium shewense TaxID=1761772 RepID=A0A1C3XTM1_9BRAD|nr:hypothetical protein [Bradyrhizobium shewense]SCB55598.1 hypothetical protein GA0061098_104615 [Bradyrhizobium shewense]
MSTAALVQGAAVVAYNIISSQLIVWGGHEIDFSNDATHLNARVVLSA